MQNIYDKIAFSIAAELNFKCYKTSHLNRYYFKKFDTNITSPPIHDGPNPCWEVPLDCYQVNVYFKDTTIYIGSEFLTLDLNDPALMDLLKEEFSDLDRLRHRIEMTRSGFTPGLLKCK